MPESLSAATDLDLISYLKAIPDVRMRRGVRIPAWYLLLVAVLGIMSGCQSLRDLPGADTAGPVHFKVMGTQKATTVPWAAAGF